MFYEIMLKCKKYKQIAIKLIALQAIIMPASVIFSHAGSLSVSVVDKDGKPAVDAVVMVYPSSSTSSPQASPAALTLSQANMQFSPAVALLQVGAKVTFINNDPWDHHVRGSAAGAKQFVSGEADGFSFRLAGKTSTAANKINSSTVTFDKPGVTLLACYLHGSMTGHVVVSDTPWATKTDVNGLATFSDVPDGTAQIKTWHAAQYVDIAPSTSTIKPGTNQTKIQLNVAMPTKRRASNAQPGYQ
jgi:plastocyanin